MEKQNILDKISSLYISKNIFEYIEDEKFQLKLFWYSKFFQKKLNINKSTCYERYINKIGFNLNDYLYLDKKKIEEFQYIYNEYYRETENKENLEKCEEKYLLNKKYDDFLSKHNLNKDKFTKIVYEIIKNKKTKDINEEDFTKKNNEILISIHSPFFEILSKTKFFENKCTIYISRNNIFLYGSIDYYIEFFDKLNKTNVNYSSIYFIFSENNDINYLNKINIDFNKIKKLILVERDDTSTYYHDSNNNNKLFQTLFTFKNIENNLIYLKIKYYKTIKLDGKLLKQFNNFKLLKYLELNKVSFNFEEKINNIITLNNLQIFSYNKESNDICDEKIHSNILNIIENCNFKELKKLKLYLNGIFDIKILEKVKFNKLEILNLNCNKIKDAFILEKSNFKNLKKLNLYNNIIEDINFLEKLKFDKLEKLNLRDNEIRNINILEKVNFKNLKHLDLSDNSITEINILKKVNFEYLETINLSHNDIYFSEFKILEKVKFPKLKILNISYNGSYFGRDFSKFNIDFLENVKFENLEILNLNEDKINNINILEKVNFKELKELYLNKNIIKDITILEKVNFEKLEILDLYSNCIDNIFALEKANFKNLKILNLNSNNYISDLNPLKNYKKLEILNLGYNKIEDINILENLKELKELDLSHNQISDITLFEKTIFLKLEKINLIQNYIDKEKYSSINDKMKWKDFRLYEQFSKKDEKDSKKELEEFFPNYTQDEIDEFFKEYSN